MGQRKSKPVGTETTCSGQVKLILDNGGYIVGVVNAKNDIIGFDKPFKVIDIPAFVCESPLVPKIEIVPAVPLSATIISSPDAPMAPPPPDFPIGVPTAPPLEVPVSISVGSESARYSTSMRTGEIPIVSGSPDLISQIKAAQLKKAGTGIPRGGVSVAGSAQDAIAAAIAGGKIQLRPVAVVHCKPNEEYNRATKACVAKRLSEVELRLQRMAAERARKQQEKERRDPDKFEYYYF